MQKGSWCKDLKVNNCIEAYLRGHILSNEEVFTESSSREREQSAGRDIYGFPYASFMGGWCRELKTTSLRISNQRSQGELVHSSQEAVFSDKRLNGAQKINTVQYLGIAADEPERLARLDGVKKISPLAMIGWTEADAKQWCIENDLLSPIYTDTCLRGGCWFCHNQGVQSLRDLRHNYPDLWALLLKWDADSPVTFHADGHTVHDFDARFRLEDEGVITPNQKWRWKYLNAVQLPLF